MKKHLAVVIIIALVLTVIVLVYGYPKVPRQQAQPVDPRIPYSSGPDSPPHVNQPTTLPPK